jgi:hypothetical protein
MDGVMMTRCAALLLGILLALLPLLAAPPARAAPVRLTVEAPPSLEPVAVRLRALDPTQFEGVQRLTGLEEPGPPIQVILAPEDSEAARYVPRWVAGYAYSERGIVVLLPARTPSYPDSSLEDLLRHEVAHVLVARAAGNRRLPRWFHEGMAMIAGLSWGLDDRTRLTLALATDRAVSLSELDRRFGGRQGEVNRAYAIAGSFVRDLLERHGPGAPAAILGGVARGLSFEDAFHGATGVSLAVATSDFWRRQTFWYRWIPLLTSSVTLWIFITLLALWAIQRRRERDAALKRMWDEEEERSRVAALAAVAAAEARSGDEPVN